MDKVLGPALRALLPRVLGPAYGAALAEAYLRSLTTVWLLPAYLISLVASMLFYAELAELAVVAEQRQVLRRHAEKRKEPLQPVEAPIKQAGALDSASETLYRTLLLAGVFAVVWALEWIPAVGSLAAGLLLAWTYALYCFDYKWEAHGVPLSARIAFLETHWGYFLGAQAVVGVSSMEIVR
ncbi:hypothetical protein QBZ16_003150 [Prototheca wickerhamii]|uniref:Uncharacterized protein n=1 Tax=Prototheca wickerhamii TaxID=3111 RepID=A0AAD9MMD2_PROWI|nr:hypothetical protein QBZ16_003150 [Prototheca wickerhamii]